MSCTTQVGGKRAAEDAIDQDRANKKSKITPELNLLELPKEILLDICSFISRLEDILRFELTCTKIRSLTVNTPKKLNVKQDYRTLDVVENITSRDLHLTELSISALHFDTDATDILLDNLTAISSFHTLKRLSLQYDFPSTDRPMRKSMLKMVWLEKLAIPRQMFVNLKELSRNHTRLTELLLLDPARWLQTENTSKCKISGYSSLQRLKALKVPRTLRQQGFNEVLQLTNLTALNLSSTRIHPEAAPNITRLMKLETIDITECNIDLNLLSALPNLRALTATNKVKTDDDEVYIKSLNRLTQLTCLRFTSDTFALQTLSCLTNLQQFHLRFFNIYERKTPFTAFKQLTSLHLQRDFDTMCATTEMLLPQGLKKFHSSCSLSSFEWSEIVKIDGLESMAINWPEDDFRTDDILQFSRLTNLKSLQFVWGDFPDGISEGLKKLPTLRTLQLEIVTSKDIEQLKVLTQLNQLLIESVHADTDITSLRQQLPYLVYKL